MVRRCPSGGPRLSGPQRSTRPGPFRQRHPHCPARQAQMPLPRRRRHVPTSPGRRARRETRTTTTARPARCEDSGPVALPMYLAWASQGAHLRVPSNGPAWPSGQFEPAVDGEDLPGVSQAVCESTSRRIHTAISAGSPRRPSGMRAASSALIWSITASGRPAADSASLSVGPGATALTRMRSGANSSAQLRVSCSSALLTRRSGWHRLRAGARTCW
jgi:hypothetical protein